MLALQSKGQWFDPCCRQLEKVVNLDENSWTHTNNKTVQMAERTLGDNKCYSVLSLSSS